MPRVRAGNTGLFNKLPPPMTRVMMFVSGAAESLQQAVNSPPVDVDTRGGIVGGGGGG